MCSSPTDLYQVLEEVLIWSLSFIVYLLAEDQPIIEILVMCTNISICVQINQNMKIWRFRIWMQTIFVVLCLFWLVPKNWLQVSPHCIRWPSLYCLIIWKSSWVSHLPWTISLKNMRMRHTHTCPLTNMESDKSNYHII